MINFKDIVGFIQSDNELNLSINQFSLITKKTIRSKVENIVQTGIKT